MTIEFLLDVFRESKNKPAIIWDNQVFTYAWLLEHVKNREKELIDHQIPSGAVVILEADFSPTSITLFLALMERNCVLVPLTKSLEGKKNELIQTAEGEYRILVDEKDRVTFQKTPLQAKHDLYSLLRSRKHPGLIVFTSGSTGKNKAALHDLTGILEKFRVHRHTLRTITFLLYDHLGGVNTMFYILSNGGCIITVQDRSPESVLEAVQKHRVELLPTTPTFLNLLLLSEAYKRYDLSSLRTVTYGTEPMAESTLRRFHELFPKINLQQTYGLTEVGIPRSKSKSSDSLWVKLGGEGFETRVVDGILHIRARSAMLGYLNAPSPFTEDGWFITGDEVEVDGEYIRILGRRSEIINVGGEKVYPAEVESVIQEIDNIAEVTVYSEKNPITGNIVCARVRLKTTEAHKAASQRIKQKCRQRLAPYQVPVKIVFAQDDMHSPRFKKIRQLRTNS